ncbi:MAG: hypothetical protein QME90_01620 [Thermodesulfobacteriota bacterium]|nr:hypothetical protein [Thermodesulfobacteriota bacterium]
MKKRMILTAVIAVVFVLITDHVQADIPKISNLKFSAKPVVLKEEFTISFEFEGSIDRLFIENTWETKEGEIKREVKEYTIPPDVKEKQNGVITRPWKIVNASVKPYRILKVWVKDAPGNQSNALSEEIKVAIPEVPKEVQKLLGKWVWTYDLGYAILTIKSITPIADNKFSIAATYENYNPTWGSDTRGRGSKLVGKIDPQRNQAEIILESKGRKIELIWDGKRNLWGYARFSTWSGRVDFRREE